jgi:hypothetical protein
LPNKSAIIYLFLVTNAMLVNKFHAVCISPSRDNLSHHPSVTGSKSGELCGEDDLIVTFSDIRRRRSFASYKAGIPKGTRNRIHVRQPVITSYHSIPRSGKTSLTTMRRRLEAHGEKGSPVQCISTWQLIGNRWQSSIGRAGWKVG